MIRRSFGLVALLPLVAAPTCAQRFPDPAAQVSGTPTGGTVAPADTALVRGTGHANDVTTRAVRWHPTFNAALDAARASGRKVLVDIYAPWCPWCRRMQAEVYPVADVRVAVAEHFEAVRLNGDDTTRSIRFTPEGQTQEYVLSPAEMAQALGAQGYPTVAFLTSTGGYVTRVPGFMAARDFGRALRFVGTEAYKTTPFDRFEASGAAQAPAAPTSPIGN